MDLSTQDQLEILSLVARYCHALDSGDVSGVVDTFTADGSFETSQYKYSGREALERFFQKNILSDDGERHFTCNHLFSGEADRAAHTCYYQVVFKGRGGIKATGVYEDSVVKEDGGWKFRRRKVVPD
jgi:ketosteroid isomerase-like protein